MTPATSAQTKAEARAIKEHYISRRKTLFAQIKDHEWRATLIVFGIVFLSFGALSGLYGMKNQDFLLSVLGLAIIIGQELSNH